MEQERDQNPTQPAVALGQMTEGVAAMQREQAVFNRQFPGMLQSQMEHLFSKPTVAPLPAACSPLAGITLHKMSEADDPQSFLEMFESHQEGSAGPAGADAGGPSPEAPGRQAGGGPAIRLRATAA
ncbi:unnamed protein product [Pleuronectes platessa]|uniref:Uncharacterized protein n=1 Tax=Pleuronectes platessa TaxID=8262 RepID=A0A9N7ZCW9_PLEPL|nr:unnamed protein product [Pleuronectes platessa]